MSSKRNIQAYGRFKDLPWFDTIAKSSITVFGQGGIGSWLTFFLARTGADLTIVDFDTVDGTNVAGQMYGPDHVGQSKVEAMKDVVSKLCEEVNITAVNKKVTVEDREWDAYVSEADVVCVSFDSIAAREVVYKRWREVGREKSLFVDGRMSAENGQVFTLEKSAVEDVTTSYESTFFNDDEVEAAPCSAKATSHCGALIGSNMTAQIINWFNNHNEKALPRTVVDRLDFYLPVSLFETQVYERKNDEVAVG